MPDGKRKVLLSGGSGLIGSAIRQAAPLQSAEITQLVRSRSSAEGRIIEWNPASLDVGVPLARLEGFDTAIHLSGANISRRWTKRYRDEIVRSRVDSTRALCTSLAKLQRPPRVLLSASAVGIYGSRGDEVLTEAASSGTGFLAETCIAWEAATAPAREAGVRVVHLRFAVVMNVHDSALGKMLPIFRAGLGGRLGSGCQWMSWISLHDVVRVLFFLIGRDDLSGPFNLAAPNPVTNQTFTEALARTLHRPALLPVPRAALRLAFGPMADEALLASQRAVSRRLQQAGFRFDDEEIGATLRGLLR